MGSRQKLPMISVDIHLNKVPKVPHFCRIEVGGAGGVCSLKCEVGSAPAHHTNVQGWKGSKGRLAKGLHNSQNLEAQDSPVNVFPPL